MIRLTKYGDVAAGFRDPRLIHERPRIEGAEAPAIPAAFAQSSLMRYSSKFMVSMDPPGHTRLRGLVNKAFTPAAVNARMSLVERVMPDLLPEASGTIDFLEVARSLPIIVIAKILGVHITNQVQFANWSYALSSTIESSTPEVLMRAAKASDELSSELLQTIEQRRLAPQDDLISALIQAEEQGGKLTEDEVVATCMLLLVAGHETTSNLIANGLYTLLQHPAELARLRANLDILPNAIDEILRFEPPARTAHRWASETFVIGDNQVTQGDRVELDVGAANRDPDVFDQPDKFNIGRDFSRNQHLTFGAGIHYCLGAPLARMQAQAVLGSVLQKWPHITLETKNIQWQDRPSIRGLKELHIRLEP